MNKIEARDIPDSVQPCSAWTESMLEMAEWIGAAATLRLVAAFGGIELYVPIELPDDHPIVHAIGMDAARRLVAVYGRERLELPAGNPALAAARRESVLAQVKAGALSKQRAARMLGTSTRYVRQLLAAPRIVRQLNAPRPRVAQLDLFAGASAIPGAAQVEPLAREPL
ncbi:MAG: hypothetical protein WCO82_00285 [Sphingomonadales bacterium]